MINTRSPLQEKVALFWHGILCSGFAKVDHSRQMFMQIDMLRRYGMGSFQDLLLELSKDPAMVMYLDNFDNHKRSSPTRAQSEKWDSSQLIRHALYR